MALETIQVDDSGGTPRKIVVDLHDTDNYTQVVKMGFAADGVTPTLVTATDQLPVDPSGTTIGLEAGENFTGSTGGKMTVITPAMTITAGAYTAGEVIGGEITLTNAMRVVSGTGMLHKVTMVDKANVKPELRCLIFDSNPAGTFTDNGLMTINAADYDNIVCEFHIESTDYVTFDDAGTDWNIASKRNMSEPVAANGSRDLFAVFVVVGTPTFTSTSQLVPKFWFVQN